MPALQQRLQAAAGAGPLGAPPRHQAARRRRAPLPSPPLRTLAARPRGPWPPRASRGDAEAVAAGGPLRALFGGEPPAWRPFLGALLLSGATLGPLLDGIHSRVGLLVYDLAPVEAGPLGLRTSLLVPPLLAAFYLTLGLLSCAADHLATGPATDAARGRFAPGEPGAGGRLAACWGALAANLQASAALYGAGAPADRELAVLAALAVANWAAFDRTAQGVALAALCAVGAPAAELVLMRWTGCWHYPRGDVLGGELVSWVPLCYAFYVPAVQALARRLWLACGGGFGGGGAAGGRRGP